MLLEMAFALVLTQDRTTTCLPMGVGVQCQSTDQSNPMAGFNAGLANGARMGAEARRDRDDNPARCAGGDWWVAGCTRAEHDAGRQAAQRGAQVTEARGRVMAHLRAGDCRAAVNAALDTGDLRFATEVREFCAAGQP